ncbi:MAG: restriction endonuclease subunit S [Treponema sp.]|nr:restriction endonuclease subunit S [Treponema sp.]
MSNIPKLRFPEFKGEWEEKRIDSIFDEKKEKNHPSEEVLTIIQGTGTVPRKESGRNIIFDEKSLSNYKFVQKDDFIIHLRSFEGGLEIANSNGIVSPAYIIMHPKLSIASKFYYSYFRSYKFINHVLPVSVEGVRDGRQIKYPILKEEKIPFTSFGEQQKIAEFLSNVDSIITAETKILKTLQKKKKALMQKLFTQQLRFKSDDGTDFPEWEEKKLGDVCSYIGGGTPSKKVKEYWNGNINWASVKDITGKYLYETQDKISQLGADSSATNICEPDSLLLITRMSPGKTVITKCITAINQDLKIVKSDINVEFLHLLFQSIQTKIDEKTSGTTVKGISIEGLNQIDIRLPCKVEQQKIADCLSSLDSLIQTQQKVVTTWQQRKKALLQQMFI